jgi:hypothetical protein
MPNKSDRPPTRRTTSLKAQVRNLDRGEKHTYATYRFSGRTFMKRDVPGKPRQV